ncbi:MAG: Hsp33 family molecular chaperone HslO [Clostridia bacterium]|jgi:molecular chaperone Hsp33|nr:Hsp33 family molecular chaperone HslO [Clostridia bacterium]
MNKLYKTLIYDREVSLSVLDTKELVNAAIKVHNLNDVSARMLGGLLTACAYMAGCLKSEKGAVSITVKSGDGSATASVSGDINGHIRGYIDGAENGLKGGTMTVIKEDGLFRPFVGTSELKCEDISENLMQYFHISEQVATAVAIGVSVENGECLAAGGVVMQLLPGTSEENMDRAENAMQDFVDICKVLKECGADGIMQKYFSSVTEEKAIYLTFPEYKCNCSRKKIEGVIKSLGKKEAMDIVAERGKVEVHCHYCNTDYAFGEEDIEELF